MDKISVFEYWCIGDVASVKGLDAWDVKVTPREERFAHQELVHSNPQRQSTTLKSNGGELNVEAQSDSAITATWLGYNSMRKTPPNVRHGDQVLLYKLGETKYYWVEINTMDEKRLETVILAISADPDKKMDRVTWQNTYFMNFSSHDKRIHLRLNKVTEEFTGYSLDFDAKTGYAKLEDDLENAVFIDSRNTTVGFQNADGTTAYGQKQDLFGYAPRDMSFTAERNITAKCQKFQIDCTDYVCNASGSYNTTTPDAKFSTQVTVPKVNAVTVAASSGVSSPSVKAGGKEITEHDHISNEPGKPTSTNR